jgi:AmmeMemoRadiSam system protein B
MHVREPAMAGYFYPSTGDQCRSVIEQCLSEPAARAPDQTEPAGGDDLALAALIGGVAPHAGWLFSGATAAEAIFALARRGDIETFVVFGAVHRRSGPYASVFCSGLWRTPLGDIAIDQGFAEAVGRSAPDFQEDPGAHAPEHSIEVEVPFIQLFAPAAMLLPIMIPPLVNAHELGRIVAGRARDLSRKAVYLASTDLTHYGPNYGFTPAGVGPDGLRWAMDVNDRRMLDLMASLSADRAVAEAREHRNACGSGAVAATMAACAVEGATRGRVLCHTSSRNAVPDRGDRDNAVGYAGVVFG